MTHAFSYHVMPDPDGQGWIVTAEGHVAWSLAYDSREAAIEVAEELVRQHPGSTIVVIDQPPALTPIRSSTGSQRDRFAEAGVRHK